MLPEASFLLAFLSLLNFSIVLISTAHFIKFGRNLPFAPQHELICGDSRVLKSYGLIRVRIYLRSSLNRLKLSVGEHS